MMLVSPKIIRQKAKEALFSKGRMLPMSLGFAVCILALAVPIMLVSIIDLLGVFSVFDEATASVYMLAVMAVITVFFFFPIAWGYLRLAYRAYTEDGRIYVADIFDCFRSVDSYFSSVVIMFVLAVRLAVQYIVPIIVSVVALGVIELVQNEFLLFFVPLLKLVAIVVGFAAAYVFVSLFLGRGYLAAYYVLLGNGVFEAFTLSHRAMQTGKKDTVKFKLGILGLALLSWLTVGTLFVVTLPIISVSYIVYAKQKTENY